MSDNSDHPDKALGPAALAALERAKRAQFGHKEWTEAVVQYRGWFRDLEGRVRQSTRGAGVPRHQRRQLDYGPYCFIHLLRGQRRATKAKGLCITCYTRLRRQTHDSRYTRRYWRYNIVCGHLERPHHGRGMCKLCWTKSYQRPVRIFVEATKVAKARRLARVEEAPPADQERRARHRALELAARARP